MAHFRSSPLVAQLRSAENQFLQILLTQFLLERDRGGTRLEVHFDECTPAIWLGRAKTEVQRLMPDFERKAKGLQARLDAFLLDGHGQRWQHDDPDFCFRYASGGTLPIIRLGHQTYYCLFYRDVFPIGWNIVNGGTATRDELRHPLVAAERELREELLILDAVAGRRYVFPGEARACARCELPAAQRLWRRKSASRPELTDFSRLEEELATITWTDGPDRLVVHTPGESPAVTTGCFLNVNAEDFGIEVDRVGEICVDASVVLCDGEIYADRLLNRPVGLFATDRMEELVRQPGRIRAIPEFFFYDAKQFPGDELAHVVEGLMLDEMQEFRGREQLARFTECAAKYDLCPVTRRILHRHLQSRQSIRD